MTVVMLHGIGGGAAGFGLLAPLVPDAVPLDLPGFGDEPRAAAPASFAALADWLVGRLDALGVARAVLLGHSFGGMLALETAARAPDRVAALVLTGATPAFGGRDPSFAEAFLAARLGPLDRGDGMRRVAEDAMAGMMPAGADPEARRLGIETMAALPEDVYRDTVRCLTTFDRRADLPAILAPALVIAGTEDAAAPLKTQARMADALPNGRLVTVEGGGHMLPLEAPARMAAEVAAFLETVAEDRA